MPPKSAEALKEEGNKHFKSRLFVQAAECYEQAEKAAPDNAIFPSNLSAALYETGDYAGSYRAIMRSAKLLSDLSSSNLATKLSTRLSKVVSYGLRNGTISPKDYRDYEEVIEQLRQATGNSEEVWRDYDRAINEHDTVVQRASSARRNLASLPIARKAAISNLEYFFMGQDDVMSIITDWGPDDRRNPLNLSNVSDERLPHLAFLWAGCGDGRHIFGSIIGLHQAYLKLTPDKRKAIKVHFTLLDIHPTVIARNLCLLLMIDQLMEMRMRKNINKVEQTEIKATIFYIWMGFILPAYCHDRFLNVVKSLLADLQMSSYRPPSWLHVTTDSIPGIIASLKYWETQLSHRTVGEMIYHHRQAQNGPNTYSDPEAIKAAIDDMDDEQVVEFAQGNLRMSAPTEVQARRKWLAGIRLMMLQTASAGTQGRVSSQYPKEEKWYNITQCFIPPGILRTRHKSFDRLWDGISQSASQSLKKQAIDHIESTWKPNPSLFHDSEFPSDYPSVELRPFDMVELIQQFNDRMGLSKRGETNEDCPAFSISEIFFDAVVEGLIGLKDHIRLELLQGDVSQELMKSAYGIDNRPLDFPRVFTRIWLSNVPDYTHGALNTAVFVMPNLELESDASVAANCLLNTGLWTNGDSLIYNYALLNKKDFARFFGCRVVSSNPWKVVEFAAKPLPRPLSTLATREELIVWLTRVLITNILPPEPPNPTEEMMFRVRYPNNLVAFFGLLTRLPAIGYPQHWISEYLNTLLADNLVTDVVPYRGKFPIPLTEPSQRGQCRRVNLEPWITELETIIALGYEALPFPVSVRLRQTDVCTYEAPFPVRDFGPLTLAERFGNADPVFSLIFFKRGTSSEKMIQRMSRDTMVNIFNEKGPGKAEIHVLSALDQFGITKGAVRWKMIGLPRDQFLD
ncbi:uncharacterized protein ARMOST_05747 [Armillaria ostoyae]|uniref:DUF4470 domain-containing protein n=1 Tax=Armillaria ostoyae TaxID=47428 RepID=A0A284R138_ARMOS|nr:uncharacterized protein ARMOST_05747 [Armillaria ostoyae]